MLAFIYAMRELLEDCKAGGTCLPTNIVFLIEGEEENVRVGWWWCVCVWWWWVGWGGGGGGLWSDGACDVNHLLAAQPVRCTCGGLLWELARQLATLHLSAAQHRGKRCKPY